MRETERAFILVITCVGFLASYTSETTLPEKAALVSLPLLMWFLCRSLARILRRLPRGKVEKIVRG
jgi:hypothetical protein